MTAEEPVLDELGLVLRIIILLENEATTKRIACIRTRGVLKDVFILKLIHDSLNPPQGTHAKARDASPNHGISTPHASLLESSTWGRNECLRDNESTLSHPYQTTCICFHHSKGHLPTLSWSSPCAPSLIPPAPCGSS
ncbi:hypothetical protein AVEN_151356-1 [Araneus ventricosus]|uniref:Uncharacterized protein n=1 Tax=Araneus ventricosus TaxID=182803 RepID=A0A4Y2C8X0_ARAVE|nr:hypothetical protein AVEN_151356-1 [Araneus ventricosus]